LFFYVNHQPTTEVRWFDHQRPTTKVAGLLIT